MKKILLALTVISMLAFVSDKPAYQLYNANGEATAYSDMIKNIKDADFIFVGELHNNAIAHWMELEITKSLYETKKENLVLSAEMFESDNQLIMDEYLNGTISQKNFEDEMRLWPNHSTDYKPLVEFAKENNLSFVAANIPRRYASAVYHNGFEGIDKFSEEAKKYCAPLPIKYDSTLACYAGMLKMAGMGGRVTPNLPKSQAMKDATMAHFIAKNWKKGQTLIHYNGAYHSENHEGTVWYLQKALPKAKILVITTVLQSDLSKLEDDYKNTGDYILVVDEDVTNTY
jgi:uncharacterized iron-regulated protein